MLEKAPDEASFSLHCNVSWIKLSTYSQLFRSLDCPNDSKEVTMTVLQKELFQLEVAPLEIVVHVPTTSNKGEIDLTRVPVMNHRKKKKKGGCGASSQCECANGCPA